MVERLRVIAGTIVWGESYLCNFFDYALPSWLSPNNLPLLFDKYAVGEFRIYTSNENLEQVKEHSRVKALADIVPVHFYTFDVDTRPGVNVTHDMWHGGIVSSARLRDETVFYLAPDVVWSDGSLANIGKSLAAGNVRVIASDYRVVSETITPELEKFRLENGSIKIPAGNVQRLLLRHFSPLLGCYYVKGKRVPDHGEIVIWPVKNEGLLIYGMSKDTGFFKPARVKFTPQNVPDVDNDFSKHDVIQDTNLVLGLSLTPLGQNLNWLRQGKPYDPVRIAQFLLAFYTAFNNVQIRKPAFISLVNNPTKELWQRVEYEAAQSFDKTVLSMNAMATNQPYAYPPAPKPDNRNLTDIDLCREALEWLEPVICLRFSQKVLGLLKELQVKHPDGNLPGYCSSWPTVLPPRP